mgnify:CR=1 FL=1
MLSALFCNSSLLLLLKIKTDTALCNSAFWCASSVMAAAKAAGTAFACWVTCRIWRRSSPRRTHNPITSKLNTIGDNFVTISGNLKEVDYAATFKKIDETLSNVKMLTEKLNSKDNTLGLLFNDPTLYNNLNATTENAAGLLKDLKEHPKRYVHFSVFGKKAK